MKDLYEKYGLKIGLEIHFQLDTGRKLFCKCTPNFKSKRALRFLRRLRPTQSELGQIDQAAYFEFKKGLTIEYIYSNETACLVEMDEEPPHEIDKESLFTALRIARYLNAYIVDEAHVMRKIVIDGSNTSGFQRTLLVALNGHIYVPEINKRVPIQTVCLEEDAGKLVERSDNKVVYDLTRLGIPLIEITTAPLSLSPDEAVAVASAIGRVVKVTGKKRRGLGSVRQDVNISILNNPVVEVKGVQKLTQLKKVIEFEFQRQINLVKVSEALRARGITKEMIVDSEVSDVSEIFKESRNEVINEALERGGRVYAVKLPGFKDLINLEIAPNYRLIREFAERVRFWVGIKGVFSIDDLLNYNIITIDKVDKLINCLNVRDSDAIIIIAGEESSVVRAVETIKERAIEAIDGVPEETRGAKEDGTTFYMRPRPGMSRMYPETDIPPILISEELLKYVDERPLKDPMAFIEELSNRCNVNKELLLKLFDLDYLDTFVKIIDKVRKVAPKFVASFLADTLRYLEREGFDIDLLDDDTIVKLFTYVEDGVIEKEVLVDAIKMHLTNNMPIDEVVKKIASERVVDRGEIKKFIIGLLDERKELRKLPFELMKKRIIAIVMSEFRGRVNPKVVLDIVDEVLKGEGHERN
ncbi:MAG: Glu-tRNA(Gln) amidotransferase subunit GatE [Candidatus Geothermarchaeota archaeon]